MILSTRDAAGLVADVLLPLLARGAILRRPRVETVLGQMDAHMARGTVRATRRLTPRD
jgi:hypothetical protein